MDAEPLLASTLAVVIIVRMGRAVPASRGVAIDLRTS